jgi:hypothetical protein
MNDQELQANYYEACIYYIEQNGGLNLENIENLFLLQRVGNKAVIIDWKHADSKKPTDDVLKAFTLQEIQSARIRRQVIATARSRQPFSLTTAQRDALGPVSEGIVIWNTTTKTMQIYHTNAWHSFAFAA